jgi:hypothetical protein
MYQKVKNFGIKQIKNRLFGSANKFYQLSMNGAYFF